MSNVSLSQVWDFIVEQGGDTYVVVDDQGFDDGRKAVYIGDNGLITVDDQDGYDLCKSCNVYALVLEDEYDHDAALKAASDLTGVLAVVGVPGSIHHRWRWFPQDGPDVDEWLDETVKHHIEVTPIKRLIETAKVDAGEAFDVKLRDGTRVYFFENIDGGFRHGVQAGDYEF